MYKVNKVQDPIVQKMDSTNSWLVICFEQLELYLKVVSSFGH